MHAAKYELYNPSVKLVWATPDGDELVAEMARVSVKDNKGKPIHKLIRYLADNAHFSPFQMCNMCIEITAPRDITRQILRHASFTGFQEYSGRYSMYTEDSDFVLREARKQHSTNRQMSVTIDSTDELNTGWREAQILLIEAARTAYREALAQGVAKEQARAVLPEGNTLSRMYINGSLRTWLHYFNVRCAEATVQREHVQVASAMRNVFAECFPVVSQAFGIAEHG